MAFCRCCGKEIHETAPTCPHCGGVQQSNTSKNGLTQDGPLWPSITSLVSGIICALSLFDQSDWDKDTIFGLGVFALIGLVFGAISISKQKNGKGMAIAGVILSSVSMLVFIGMLPKL